MIWQRLLQGCIFLTASLLTVLLAAGSFGLIALGLILKMRGQGLTLDSDRLSLWPSGFGAVEIHAWGAPWYGLAGVACLLVVLPMVLLALEHLFIKLRPTNAELLSDGC